MSLGQHRVILEALLLFLLLLGGLVQHQTLSHIVSDLIATDTLVILSCIALLHMFVGAVGSARLSTILANRRIAKEVRQLLFLLSGPFRRLSLLLGPPLLLSEVGCLPGSVLLLALALESLVLQRQSFFLLLDSFSLLDSFALQSFLFTGLLARHLLLLFCLLAHPLLKLSLSLLLLFLLL